MERSGGRTWIWAANAFGPIQKENAKAAKRSGMVFKIVQASLGKGEERRDLLASKIMLLWCEMLINIDQWRERSIQA